MVGNEAGRQVRSRRAEALDLADELLGDIELHRLEPLDLIRKASRLARLLDDADAMQWLEYETAGYPPELDPQAVKAAQRSGRAAPNGKFWTGGLGRLQETIDGAKAAAASLTGAAPAGEWALRVNLDRAKERNLYLTEALDARATLDSVVGAVHAYVAARYHELRFGSAVETAFEVVRNEVDGAIAAAVPNALTMLSGAMENAVSENPEHWASAAGTCRRLLKAVADVLQPPGDPVTRRGQPIQMGDGHYINRLVVWIEGQAKSSTSAALVAAELEYLGRRLDAVDAAGQKGAHANVTKLDASRFLVATYMLLGDILRLMPDRQQEGAIDSISAASVPR